MNDRPADFPPSRSFWRTRRHSILAALSEGRRMAQTGAGYCESAINLAAQLVVNDEALYLADSYYFARGSQVAATRFAVDNQSFTPRYRRVSALLFTPSSTSMRADPRFAGPPGSPPTGAKAGRGRMSWPRANSPRR